MKISARNTRVVELPPDKAFKFIEDNHSQGAVRLSTAIVSIALLSEDTIVAVAQFCNPRTAAMKKKYTIELLRLAFKRDVRVIGGASKLLKFFREEYNPADIFTYQDTTGEATNVYEHCGFSLVREYKRKVYLVAPNRTLQTAKRNEYFSVGHVVRNGPDRLLGTTIGEVFHEDGRRKTNIELFEELGWHQEETSGDRVYEWINPNFIYYTYKITSSNSDKYYFGVRKTLAKRVNEDGTVNDSYMGSGGEKFKNWRKKYSTSLQKEVLAFYKSKAEAYNAEEKLVGDLYKTDPLCLNSTPGGNKTIRRRAIPQVTLTAECEVHGETKHVNGLCRKCTVASRANLRDCLIHGSVIHQGNACYSCIREKIYTTRECSKHGLTKFRGANCAKCQSSKHHESRECTIHGLTFFHGNTCSKCAVSDRNVIKHCVIHGESNFQGDSCYSCFLSEVVKEQVCPIHGLTKFRNESCYKCFTQERTKIGICEVHGETKFSGKTCAKCTSQKSIIYGICEKHGEVKFRGTKCSQCLVDAQYTVEECPTHGTNKHRVGKCCKCSAEAQKAKRKKK